MNRENLLAGLRHCSDLMNEMDILQGTRNNICSGYSNYIGYHIPFKKEWKGISAVLKCIGIFLLLFIVLTPRLLIARDSDFTFLMNVESPRILNTYYHSGHKKTVDRLFQESQKAYNEAYSITDGMTEEEILKIDSANDKDKWIATWLMEQLKDELEALHNKAILMLIVWTVIAALASALITWGITRLVNKYIRKCNISIVERNKKIETEKIRLHAKNQEIQQQEMEVIQKMDGVKETFQKEVRPWFPPDYLFPDALRFFIHAVENSRANTMTEAVNLYEDMLHKLRMEKGQQEMLKKQRDIEQQQKFGNLLAAGSLAAQFMNGQAISRNTDAVNAHTDAVNTHKTAMYDQTNAMNRHKSAVDNVGDAIRRLRR